MLHHFVSADMISLNALTSISKLRKNTKKLLLVLLRVAEQYHTMQHTSKTLTTPQQSPQQPIHVHTPSTIVSIDLYRYLKSVSD